MSTADTSGVRVIASAQNPPITLVTPEHSWISNINLYTNRAEVTRVFQFEIAAGQNTVKITKLPNFADENSVKVEGKGPATIHDVSISHGSSAPIVMVPEPSPIMDNLLDQADNIRAAIGRVEKAEHVLEQCVKDNKVDITRVGAALTIYGIEGDKLYVEKARLWKSLKDAEKEIKAEEEKHAPHYVEGPDPRLTTIVTVKLQAASKGKVELQIAYSVFSATWSAAYDIRADISGKEPAVHLTYRAIIQQNTGEDWTSAPLSLETSTPTSGLEVPVLLPWTLNVQAPVSLPPPTVIVQPAAMIHYPRRPSYADSRSRSRRSASESSDGSVRCMRQAIPVIPPPPMEYRPVQAESNGDVTATFKIAGFSDIPSDNIAHSVIITELDLKSTVSWVCVPKKDSRVYLKAKITNSSNYTFLRGPANIYVNSSFISKSNVPLVNPEDSFDCSLGLDPSVRVTVHPQIKKAGQSGFYNKSSTQVYTQRLTVFNSKQIPVTNMKIIDQYPVSQHQDIVVKLVSPPLSLPETSNNGSVKIANPVKITSGVTAQWSGHDEEGVDALILGKDGIFNWMCSLPAQGKVNLTLQWDVKWPSNIKVSGLQR